MRPNTCAPIAGDRCASTAIPRPSSASATRCRCGRPARSGPFDHWPTPGGGFEHFYGFIGGETNQYYPAIYEGTPPVEPPETPEQGYHFTEDMADKAIGWIRQQKALAPDKPFFLYFAPGATHAPHHVPAEWSDRYAGEFDHGWDALREKTFERQKALGVIPADADLTARSDGHPGLGRDVRRRIKPVLARQMEVYAGFLAYTDHHIGRLIDALDELGDPREHAGLLDHRRQRRLGRGVAAGHVQRDGHAHRLRRPGDPGVHGVPRRASSARRSAYNHYAVGWAHAMDTPYQWTKQVASHWGGTRNGTIVHWPAGITGEGRDPPPVPPRHRRRADHPRGRRAPRADDRPRRAQLPHGGHQHGRTRFNDADAPERHSTQYFEMVGNRGIYHQGWTAVTKHRTPWDTGDSLAAFDDDVWELYDTNTDWTQAHDVADEHPDKLARAATAVAHRGRQAQRPPARRPVRRTRQPRHRRPPALITGNATAALRGHGPTQRELRHQPEEQVAHDHCPRRDPRGRCRAVCSSPGRHVGGWSLYTRDGVLGVLLQLLGMSGITSRPTPR